ncbi:DUF2971 domain-containing protein [Rhizobium mongolense]|nr:DUF2971 domain-containing protein [Rhizobium mongolense]MBB4232634.1 hypothetical protein [Rhizobium mongolense]
MALQNRRLKIARIKDLNDPFELLGWNLRGRETRERLKKWKSERNDEFGILCMSHKWSHPLLWAHYAEKHKGMALGFDVPESDVFLKIKYCRRRVAAPAGRNLVERDLDGLLLTKFTAWKYETEYRCFCSLKGSIRDGEHFFEPFSDTLKLKEVIVGDQATISRQGLADALGAFGDGIVSFKARPAFGSFRVVRNRDSKLWK